MLELAKAERGEHWRRLFRGDPDGARCLLPPYRLAGARSGLACSQVSAVCWSTCGQPDLVPCPLGHLLWSGCRGACSSAHVCYGAGVPAARRAGPAPAQLEGTHLRETHCATGVAQAHVQQPMLVGGQRMRRPAPCLPSNSERGRSGRECRPRARAEGDDDAVLELDLPFWTEPEDVAVAITDQALRIAVRGALELRRAYWRNRRAPRWGAERARGGGARTRRRNMLHCMPCHACQMHGDGFCARQMFSAFQKQIYASCSLE